MIWCDLDNTLICRWDPVIPTPLLSALLGRPLQDRPTKVRGRRRLMQVIVPGYAPGDACSRKGSLRFLKALRQIDEVRMLTSAVRPYAEAMNSAFGLGFVLEQIVSWEDISRAGAKDKDPGAVLIDNRPEGNWDRFHAEYRQRKLAYLGISAARVVEVSYFSGSVSDSFGRDWPRYVASVRQLLSPPAG